MSSKHQVFLWVLIISSVNVVSSFEIVKTSPAIQHLSQGSNLRLTCKSNTYYEYCEWRHIESGQSCLFEWRRSHNAVKRMQCSDSWLHYSQKKNNNRQQHRRHRVRFVGNYAKHECSIQISNVFDVDTLQSDLRLIAGNWSCEMEAYVWGVTRGAKQKSKHTMQVELLQNDPFEDIDSNVTGMSTNDLEEKEDRNVTGTGTSDLGPSDNVQDYYQQAENILLDELSDYKFEGIEEGDVVYPINYDDDEYTSSYGLGGGSSQLGLSEDEMKTRVGSIVVGSLCLAIILISVITFTIYRLALHKKQGLPSDETTPKRYNIKQPSGMSSTYSIKSRLQATFNTIYPNTTDCGSAHSKKLGGILNETDNNETMSEDGTLKVISDSTNHEIGDGSSSNTSTPSKYKSYKMYFVRSKK